MKFISSGDLGDSILSLPVIRHKGGGVLYLRAANFTRAPMTWEHAQAIVPLLKAQPYIEDVLEWKGENCDVDLDRFRRSYFEALRRDMNKYRRSSLAYWYAFVFDVPIEEWDKPWLTVTPVLNYIRGENLTVIANRSARYHNPRFPWDKVVEKYNPSRIGVDGEQETIPGYGVFVMPQDLLLAAENIAGARLFVGNQSACHAICKGLGKPFVLEVYPTMPNCIYAPQEHEHYGWDENVFLPDLKDLP